MRLVTIFLVDVYSKDSFYGLLSYLIVSIALFQRLTTVSFRSTSLVSLSLGGCRAITSLELKCPYLEHVSLDGCDHLERASFSPVSHYLIFNWLMQLFRFSVSMSCLIGKLLDFLCKMSVFNSLRKGIKLSYSSICSLSAFCSSPCHNFYESIAGWSQVIKYGNMPETECAPC